MISLRHGRLEGPVSWPDIAPPFTVKQHLHIKSFFGTSENAVKTQVWIAMSVYVLIAILRKRLAMEHLTLWQISQVLSLTSFEKTPVTSLFLHEKAAPEDPHVGKQLSVLDV